MRLKAKGWNILLLLSKFPGVWYDRWGKGSGPRPVRQIPERQGDRAAVSDALAAALSSQRGFFKILPEKTVKNNEDALYCCQHL